MWSFFASPRDIRGNIIFHRGSFALCPLPWGVSDADSGSGSRLELDSRGRPPKESLSPRDLELRQVTTAVQGGLRPAWKEEEEGELPDRK